MLILTRVFVTAALFCLVLSVDCFAENDKKTDKYAIVKEDTFIYSSVSDGFKERGSIVKKGVRLKIIRENWYDEETWYRVESIRPYILGYLQEQFLEPVGWSFKRNPIFQLNPQTEFGFMILGISLPEQFNFAKGVGGGIPLPQQYDFVRTTPKYCPQCAEPNHPTGSVFYLGGALNIRIVSRAVLGMGALLSGGSTDFRAGFTDRRYWPAPGEGEAYTYTRLSSLERIIPYVNLGYMGTFDRRSISRYFGSYEFGVRWLRLEGLALEQGFDRFNSRNPRRTITTENSYVSIRGYYFDIRYHEGKVGGFATFMIIPRTSIDFKEFGEAHISGRAFSGGLSVQF